MKLLPALLLGITALPCSLVALAYEYVPLDPPVQLPDLPSYPNLSISDFREVLIGISSVSFVWRPVPLHGLPSEFTKVNPPSGSSYIFCNGINDRGQVIGRDGQGRIGLWLPEPDLGLPSGTNLLPFNPTYDFSKLNNKGEVVTTFDNDVHILWLPAPAYGRPAGNFNVPVQNGLGYTASISQINDNGLVTGDFNDGKLSVSLLQDLPGYSGTGLISMFSPPKLGSTIASNNKNQLLARIKGAGNKYTYSLFLPLPEGEFAAGWHDIYSGTESFLLRDFNDRGEVLGFRSSGGSFLWSLDQGFRYLDTMAILPADTTSATYQGLNNNGDLVGYRRTISGTRAFMLSVPEPVHATMVVMWASIALGRRRLES